MNRNRNTNPGAIWLQLAVLYLIVGVALGIVMGASRDFTLRPVHAHLNLLGWATMAVAGLVYSVYEQAGRSVLARIHFWLANVSMPIMALALSLVLLGKTAVVPMLVVSEMLAAAGILVFAANLFLNLNGETRTA